jgi:GT2 family glycosyltransferase
MSCVAAHEASPGMPVLVIDASATEATRQACDLVVRRYEGSSRLIYHRARSSGLARQRNEAIGLCRGLDVDIVHFIDDDTEVLPGYFDAIERRFAEDPAVIGLGGIITNQPVFNHLRLRSFFLLRSPRPGSALRSGRNMLGQYPDARATDAVDWLNGCSMSYRMAAFDEAVFDERLDGPSLGEDYDFSFRLSRTHKLAVEPAARCIHHVTPSVRGSKRATAREGTENTYRRVKENRARGMSLLAFWWATFGDLVLHAASSIVYRSAAARQETVGICDAVVAIVRRAGAN